MKGKCYINGIGAVSYQGIWTEDPFENVEEVAVPLAHAKQPSYKDLIAPAMIRRMSKVIKIGIYASQQALDEAGSPALDAVLTGTGLGCLEDSEKFLKNILDNEEQFLTPTSFIQSTHNTVGAQIALRLGCKAYNFTYVNGATSFESALLDGLMQIQNDEAQHILVGGVDEISGHTFVFKQEIKEVKQNDINETIKDSSTAGVNFGEGATFFVLGSTKSDASYAEVMDTSIQNQVDFAELDNYITSFLRLNSLTMEDISVLGIGNNGDLQFDKYYVSVSDLFPHSTVFYYKHLTGHSDVASAFGMAVGATVLKNQAVHENILWKGQQQEKIKFVLLYNQYQGKNHSLTLLKAI